MNPTTASSGIGGANMAQVASNVPTPPKVYKVGDTLKLINHGYNVNEYRDGYFLQNDQQVLEVEVKSVKVAKTTLEEAQ